MIAMLVSSLLISFSTTALADVGPQVDAPDLDYGTWLAHGPADPSTPDQLEVVEVWATWCGPCRESLPKLSQLQASYGDAIRVVALTDDRIDQVRAFYRAHQEDLQLAVAVTESDSVQSLLFGGFGGRGLPSVYVMRDGKMLWSGHPNQLEPVLASLVEGREPVVASSADPAPGCEPSECAPPGP